MEGVPWDLRTSTIPKKFGLYWKDNFHNFHTQWKMELYSNTFHNFKKIGFTLKVSLKETFHNFHPQWKISNFEETDLSQFSKNEIILKVFLEETPSIIFKTLGLYWKCLFSQFPKNGIILKVSLEETPSII